MYDSDLRTCKHDKHDATVAENPPR